MSKPCPAVRAAMPISWLGLRSRAVGLINGDLNRGKRRSVHPGQSDQLAMSVAGGNDTRLAPFQRLLVDHINGLSRFGVLHHPFGNHEYLLPRIAILTTGRQNGSG